MVGQKGPGREDRLVGHVPNLELPAGDLRIAREFPERIAVAENAHTVLPLLVDLRIRQSLTGERFDLLVADEILVRAGVTLLR